MIKNVVKFLLVNGIQISLDWLSKEKQKIQKLENSLALMSEKVESLEKALSKRDEVQDSIQSSLAPKVPQVPPIPVQQETTKNSPIAKPCQPELEKYHKMLLIGIPEGAVKQKMLKDGIDVLLLFPNEVTTNQQGFGKAELPLKKPSIQNPCIIPTKAGPKPGLNITVEKLAELRGSLRKTPRRMCLVTPEKRRLLSSDGKSVKSPSTARSNVEFLELALHRKFQNMSSPSVKF